jgi:hypothetical protein
MPANRCRSRGIDIEHTDAYSHRQYIWQIMPPGDFRLAATSRMRSPALNHPSATYTQLIYRGYWPSQPQPQPPSRKTGQHVHTSNWRDYHGGHNLILACSPSRPQHADPEQQLLRTVCMYSTYLVFQYPSATVLPHFHADNQASAAISRSSPTPIGPFSRRLKIPIISLNLNGNSRPSSWEQSVLGYRNVVPYAMPATE